MQAGGFAVHYSASLDAVDANGCDVLPSLVDAEQFAEQVLKHPSLQCRIFDHQGFVGAPVLEVRGTQYKDRHELSPLFRRWVGSILFFGGAGMFLTDWIADFHYDWPSVLGSRLMMPGLILLVTEALMVQHKRRAVRGQGAVIAR